jgi:hypothetical protein
MGYANEKHYRVLLLFESESKQGCVIRNITNNLPIYSSSEIPKNANRSCALSQDRKSGFALELTFERYSDDNIGFEQNIAARRFTA